MSCRRLALGVFLGLTLSAATTPGAARPKVSRKTVARFAGVKGDLLPQESCRWLRENPYQPRTKAFFDEAKRRVKALFVERESQIETIFQQTESCYLEPDPKKRAGPVKIFLPGPTRTGKTSLVKAFVVALGLEQGFCSFNMREHTGESDGNRIDVRRRLQEQLFRRERVVEGMSLSQLHVPNDPVLLIDEVDKISTWDPQKNKPVERPLAQPLLDLLGEGGRLTVYNPAYRELNLILEKPDLYLEIPSEIKYREENKAKRERMESELLDIARELAKHVRMQTTIDLSGGIFFIAGNLNNAFVGANNMDPDALTADELHQMSQLTSHEVMTALTDKFGPEDIARLGGRIVPFSTFSEAGFRTFIDRRLKAIAASASKDYKIRLSFTDRVKQRIYREGVRPSQGIDPLAQMVDLFGRDPLATIFAEKQKHPEAYTNRKKMKVLVDVGEDAAHTTWTVKNGPLAEVQRTFAIPDEGIRLKRLRPEPARTVVATRLAAQATVGIQLNESLPLRIFANSRDKNRDGVVNFWIDQVKRDVAAFMPREVAMLGLAFLFAPYVAEEMTAPQGPSRASRPQLDAAKKVAEALIAAGLGPSRGGVPQNNEANVLLDEAKQLARSILRRERRFWSALAKTLHGQVEVTKERVGAILQDPQTGWSDPAFVKTVLAKKPRPTEAEGKLMEFFDNPEAFDFLPSDRANPIGFTAPIR